MPGALSDDSIEAYGLDDFSADFLTALDRAEEAFPSSFRAPAPPAIPAVLAALDDDDYDSMYLEPCSQAVAAALDEMEHPDFVPTSASQPGPVRPRRALPYLQLKAPASTAPCVGVDRSKRVSFGGAFAGRVPASKATARSTIVPSVIVKMEPSSPTSTLVGSSSPPAPVLASKRRRRSSLSDNDSDSESAEEEVAFKKPKVERRSSSPPGLPRAFKRERARGSSVAENELELESQSDSDSDCEVVAFKKPKLSPPSATPLSQFFASYPKYTYDPAGPASQQFNALRTVYKLARGRPAAQEAYAAYNRALGITFSQNYGDAVDNLGSWQRLCRVVEIAPVPETLEECQCAIEDAHVNLIDLIDVLNTGARVHRFKTEQELSVYTRETDKIFPSADAYKGPLLRHLLRRIFYPPKEGLMRRGGKWVRRKADADV
ncbi:hypothetical protein B0H17DRAFT_1081364 [Mycena rosella]|uniref:Uncharacterized protein n=1 Tax=Mycena rosella TaxID=1033263 RepID=A0AAD7G7U5_MYCRO|nr:hypothetical protein B0H17DRAFT_1081364 [Mycena rosella]